MELNTATELIYRKAGRVSWGPEQIEIVLDRLRAPWGQARRGGGGPFHRWGLLRKLRSQ
jgi:hypothetical protein